MGICIACHCVAGVVVWLAQLHMDLALASVCTHVVTAKNRGASKLNFNVLRM